MQRETSSALLRGAGAGLLATAPQTLVGKLEERLFLPPGEDADIAPRLVERVAGRVGVRLPTPVKWVLGTAYHLGYGCAWGAAYAFFHERRPLPPLLGGFLLGCAIYAIAFQRWGPGVLLGAERPPGVRSRRMTLVASSVSLSFGLATAFLYERLRR